jgi:hypothetical protein
MLVPVLSPKDDVFLLILIAAIKQIQGKEIIFKCGRKASISGSYNDFNKHYSKWIFGREK